MEATSNTYFERKQFIDYIFELEKQECLQKHIMREYQNDFNMLEAKLIRKEERLGNRIAEENRKSSVVEREKNVSLEMLKNALPRAKPIPWIIWFIVGIPVHFVIMIILGRSGPVRSILDILDVFMMFLPFITSAIMATFLVNLPRLLAMPKYRKKCAEVCRTAREKEAEIDEERQKLIANKKRMEEDNRRLLTDCKNKLETETAIIRDDIMQIASAKMALYQKNLYFPEKFHNDFAAVSAIKEYLDTTEDYTKEHWNIALLHGERVVDLRMVDERLSGLTSMMEGLGNAVRKELSSLEFRYRMEMNWLKQEQAASLEVMNEQYERMERSYHRDAEVAYAAVWHYLDINNNG